MSKKRIIYTGVVTLIVVFTTTFAVLMTLERMDYRNYLQAQYSKNMYDLINSVENIRSNLGKAPIIGSREQSIIVFSEIFRYSGRANDKLHSLPLEPNIVGDTSKFLSKVGDFCYTLAVQGSQGKELSEKEYELIDDLEMQSFILQQELNKLLSEINEGKVRWGEIRKKASGVFAKNEGNLVSNKFKGIQKQIAQYPALIYDGPFSDNIIEIKPRIEEKNEVSQAKAVEVIENLLGKENIENIEVLDHDGKTRIPSYRFKITIRGRDEDSPDVVCEVSKRGGRIVYLLDNKNIGEPTIKDREKIIDVGNKFLDKLGYKDMEPTYILNYGESAIVTYVYNQGDIVIYPDQIKVKIALDNGSIMGIESDKYLTSHIDERDIPAPKITETQARERVGKRLKINSIKLAIIPTETNKEVLCYEFAGKYNDKDYIVYINAETGFEQRIIEIMDTPNGQLTL